MKRLLKYLIALLIVLVCVYGFWAWLQYKGATVIKKTTASIMTELAKVDKLETAKKSYTKIIEGEQQFASLLPDIGIDQIIDSALFHDKMILEVIGEVSAGYMINDITTENIEVSRDGTITILLGEPELFGVMLTGELQTSKSGIVAQSEIALEHQLREKAGELMIQEALNGGILQEAKNNAQSALQDVFLKAQIQIKEVIIQSTGTIE